MVAPSDDNVIYVGTGEGALSGDSYAGNGIIKSTDGGNTWTHVSGDFFYRRLGRPSRRRPDQRQPRLRRDHPRPRRRSPRHADRALSISVCGSRRTAPSPGRSSRRPRPAPRAPPSSNRPDQAERPVRLVSRRHDLQEHRRRRHLEPDHERPADGGRLRCSADALLHRPLAPGRPVGRAVRRLRLDQRAERPPSVGGPSRPPGGADLQVHRRGASGSGAEGTGQRAWPTTAARSATYDNVIETDPNNPNVVFAGGSFGYDLSPPSGGIFRSDRRRRAAGRTLAGTSTLTSTRSSSTPTTHKTS